METPLPILHVDAISKIMLDPTKYDRRSLVLLPQQVVNGRAMYVRNEALIDQYEVAIYERTKTGWSSEPHELAIFGNKASAMVFSDTISRMMDRDGSLAVAAMCMWEAVLQPDAGSKVKTAIEATLNQHGVSAVRDAVQSFAFQCDLEWWQAVNEADYDDPFDLDWCPDFICTRLIWDETGANLPRLDL